MIGLFHPVAGMNFHSVKCVWFVYHKILCACYDVARIIVEIVTVYVCIMFFGVGVRVVRIGDSCRQACMNIYAYAELHKNVRNVWAIRSGACVQERKNLWVFIIDLSIHRCINVAYRPKKGMHGILLLIQVCVTS